MNFRTHFLVPVLLLCTDPLLAADNANLSNTSETGSKRVQVGQASQPPVIDGKLDDAVWQQAGVISDLHQVRPGDGAPVSERTDIYFLMDKDAVYIGARMWDREPQAVNRSVMKHGAGFSQDDRIAIILDPFNTGRQGYRFETNANGVRHEQLYQNNKTREEWVVVWEAGGVMTDDGWTAEMAIPFKSLPFDPAVDTWGLNIARAIRRRGEESVWVSRNRAFNPSIVGQAGGFEGMDAGLGLDLVPSLTYQQQKSYLSGTSDSSVEPSFEAYYRILPALTGSLTINTDFSGTEVDDRQVNLTRFNLFFPEKRKFFLNDADVFEFGRIGEASYLEDNRATSRSTQENARPFFSRSLGLNANGMPVDILYGGKLSGRVGPVSIGALAIRQDESVDRSGARIPASNAIVARVATNVLAESSIGLIATSGNLRSDVDSQLVGADFLYTNTRFAGGRTLEADAWLQRSITDGMKGDDVAYGLGARIPNASGWRGGASLREIQKNFYPALGFVNDTGIRAYYGDVGYTHIVTGKVLHSLYSGVDVKRVTSLETGAVDSQTIALRPLELAARSRDELKFVYTLNTENLTQPYEVYPGTTRSVTLPVGKYKFDDYGFDFVSATQRDLSGEFYVRTGDFYSGDRRNVGAKLNWTVSRNLLLTLGHDWNDVRLPEGSFITRLNRVGAEFYFNTDLYWVSLLQYDDVSELFGIHSRLVWIPKPGQEYLLVVNKGYQDYDKDNSFRSANQELNAKASYTFRF